MSGASGGTPFTWHELADAVWLAALRADVEDSPPDDDAAGDSHSPPSSPGVPGVEDPPEPQTSQATSMTGLAGAYLRTHLAVDDGARAGGTRPGRVQEQEPGAIEPVSKGSPGVWLHSALGLIWFGLCRCAACLP
jgi:hypothetical protein